MKYVRGIVYVCTAVASGLCYWYLTAVISSPALRNIRLTEVVGLISVLGIYLALLPSPLYAVFPKTPARAVYMRARRAIGLSTFVFAVLHTYLGLFSLLGGWGGLAFLSRHYLADTVLSAVALFILLMLTATSTDWAQRRLGAGWRRLHRLVYLAGALTLLHMATVGSHFMAWTKPAFLACAVLVLLLIALEGMRISRLLQCVRHNLRAVD